MMLIKNIESIADFTKRPLYTIGCSDLTHSPVEAEEKLSAALSLSKRWNAITLIDEADVFMAERNIRDLNRNELVSGPSIAVPLQSNLH